MSPASLFSPSVLRRLPRAFLLAGAALMLGACASKAPARLGDAATTPLNDLNLVRAEIPPILVEARKGAYAAPSDRSCAALAQEIGKLDDALGADLDAPARPGDPGLVERGEEAAGDAVVGALQRTAEGVIPFRGWARKLTGAEAHEKRVQAAIAAGIVRRAYLKGLAAAQDCRGEKLAQGAPK